MAADSRSLHVLRVFGQSLSTHIVYKYGVLRIQNRQKSHRCTKFLEKISFMLMEIFNNGVLYRFCLGFKTFTFYSETDPCQTLLDYKVSKILLR